MSMERKVGEEFFSGFYGESYEVCNAEIIHTCIGCDFRTFNKIGCKGVLEETGDCSSKYRSDGMNVIFKKVWRKK